MVFVHVHLCHYILRVAFVIDKTSGLMVQDRITPVHATDVNFLITYISINMNIHSYTQTHIAMTSSWMILMGKKFTPHVVFRITSQILLV